jgi:hypothetical protein
MHSFAFFQAIEKQISNCSILRQKYKDVKNLSSMIPASFCVDGLIFEAHIDQDESPVDISYFLGSPRCELLSDASNLATVSPAWEILRGLLNRWNDGTSLFAKSIYGIWLEFDLPASNPLEPSIFLSLKEGYASPIEVLNDLSFIPPDYKKTTTSFIEQVNEGACVKQIGFMAAREKSPIRLCLAGIDKQFERFLRKIGYPHELDEFIEIYNELAVYCDRVDLAIDITERVEDRIGLEFFMQSANPDKDPLCFKVYETLVKRGLCTPRNQDELANFFKKEEIEIQGRKFTSIKSVSHLKLCYSPTQGIRAKSYFWLKHIPYVHESVFSPELLAEL